MAAPLSAAAEAIKEKGNRTMKKIAIINLKGGVGKTTTTANFAYNLGKEMKKVLVIDCDKQGNLSRIFNRKGKTLAEVLTGKCSAAEAVVRTPYFFVDIIPADINLLSANQQLDRPDILGKVLEQQEKSDYEKVQDTMRLKELISRKKKDENIPGSVRDMTAEALGETPTQIARYEAINKNLCPELKEELKEGKIGISAAYEASRLVPEQQQQIMQQPERSIKAIKSLSDSDKLEKQQKKQQREQLKEEFAAYICDELCKHTMKKEANLIKQCERCRVDKFLEELK